MILSKEDPLKMDDVLNLNIQEALSYLLYVIESRRKQEEQIKNRKVIR